MLKRLRIKNFKLLQDVEIRFEDPLTVFIGPNAAGKSTVLEVLEFLRRCAHDGLQEAVRAHGGLSTVRTASTTEAVEFEVDWGFRTGVGTSNLRKFDLRWSFSLVSSGIGAGVRSEQLHDGNVPRVSTGDGGVRTVHDETDPTKSASIREPPRLAFESLRDDARFPSLGSLRRILATTRYLGTLSSAPAWARASADRPSARDAVVLAPEPFIGAEGLGLANALYNLYTDHGEVWNVLERAFRAEYAFVKRIVFPPDPGGSRIAFAYEDTRFSGQKIYASQMSDGMIAFLTLLTAVLQPRQYGVLALDEPDAHLHPSAVRRFISLCQGDNRARRVAIVTHSNTLLDALDDPARVIRIVEPGPDGARLRSLDPASLAEWRKEYTLSELRRTGMLDQDNTAYGTTP